MKRISIIICCFMLLPFQMLTAYARNILQNLVVISSELPNEAVYIDMLIYMDEKDEAYTPYNEENMKQYSFDTNTIANYSNEGFISMSCHYKDNFTKMKIQANTKGKYVNSFTLRRISDGDLVQNSTLVYKLLNEKRQFRIALLDKNGSIIQLSEPFDSNGKKGELINYIEYDAGNNIISLDYEYSGAPLWWVRTVIPLYVIIGIIIIIAVIKFLIFRLRHFISRHKHDNIE